MLRAQPGGTEGNLIHDGSACSVNAWIAALAGPVRALPLPPAKFRREMPGGLPGTAPYDVTRTRAQHLSARPKASRAALGKRAGRLRLRRRHVVLAIPTPPCHRSIPWPPIVGPGWPGAESATPTLSATG